MSDIVKINSVPVSMDSKEIAKLLEKDHGNVLRDMRLMLIGLYGDDYLAAHMPPNYAGGRNAYIQANADAIFRAVFKDDSELNHPAGFTWKRDGRGYLTRIAFDKRHTITLISGYDAKVRLRIVDRLEELENKMAAPKAIPYTTGRGDTLTGEEAEELRDMLTDGVERLPKATQGKAMKQGWSKLIAHFKVETYRKIPRAEFREALSLIGRHLAGLESKVPRLHVPQPDSLHRALDSMNLMAESVANMAEAIVHLSRGSPPSLEKGEGLTAPTVSPSNEKRTAPTVQTS